MVDSVWFRAPLILTLLSVIVYVHVYTGYWGVSLVLTVAIAMSIAIIKHSEHFVFNTLLKSILSKFELTSLVVRDGNKDEDIFMSFLQIVSIQETLEHFIIYSLYIFKCISVVEQLVEFKRIKAIRIECYYSNDDKFEELKLDIKQFEKKLKKKCSEIEIYLGYQKREF